MPSQPAIPPLLTNHLSLPPDSSLTLLTSVLGASSNWLVLRFLYSTLSRHKAVESVDIPANETKSVFVSWLRDISFWKEGARKLGVDITDPSRVTFIDGLGTGLGLKNEGFDQVEKEILSAVLKFKDDGSKVMVMLDGLDFLLAAAEISVGEILDCVGDLREHASVVVALSADSSLLHIRQTPLEINHASLVMSLSHQARQILSVRELDTGVARDVSGVLRVGGRGDEVAEGVEATELLYFVAGDGGVRVFERGA